MLTTLTSAALTAALITGPTAVKHSGWEVTPRRPILSPAACAYTVTGSRHRVVTVFALVPTGNPARFQGTPATVQVVKGGAAWAARKPLDVNARAIFHAPFGGAGSRHYVTVGTTHCTREW